MRSIARTRAWPHRARSGSECRPPAPTCSPDTVEPIARKAILRELLELDPALRRECHCGERAVFYNPGRAAPLGVIFASIKDRDGPDDARAALARPGVYRLAFELRRDAFAQLFSEVPARPTKVT